MNLIEKIDEASRYVQRTKENEFGNPAVEVERTAAFYRGQRWALAMLLAEVNGNVRNPLEYVEDSVARVGLVSA